MAVEAVAKERLGAWSMAINAIEYAATPGEVGWHISRLALPGLLYIVVGLGLAIGVDQTLQILQLPSLVSAFLNISVEQIIKLVVFTKLMAIAMRHALFLEPSQNPIDFGRGEQRFLISQLMIQWPTIAASILVSVWIVLIFPALFQSARAVSDDPFAIWEQIEAASGFWTATLLCCALPITIVFAVRLATLSGRALDRRPISYWQGWRDTKPCWGVIARANIYLLLMLMVASIVPMMLALALTSEIDPSPASILFELFGGDVEGHVPWTILDWLRVGVFWLCVASLTLIALAALAHLNAQIYRRFVPAVDDDAAAPAPMGSPINPFATVAAGYLQGLRRFPWFARSAVPYIALASLLYWLVFLVADFLIALIGAPVLGAPVFMLGYVLFNAKIYTIALNYLLGLPKRHFLAYGRPELLVAFALLVTRWPETYLSILGGAPDLGNFFASPLVILWIAGLLLCATLYWRTMTVLVRAALGARLDLDFALRDTASLAVTTLLIAALIQVMGLAFHYLRSFGMELVFDSSEFDAYTAYRGLPALFLVPVPENWPLEYARVVAGWSLLIIERLVEVFAWCWILVRVFSAATGWEPGPPVTSAEEETP